jgi:hypothetical protein
MRLILVKPLGTCLFWVRVQTGDCEVQVLNCYLEPGEQQFQKRERVVRVAHIIKDILKKDANAAIVVNGEFNKHIHRKYHELPFLKFTPELDPQTIADKFVGYLIFAREVNITYALVNDDFDSGLTDHKCLKSTIKLK